MSTEQQPVDRQQLESRNFVTLLPLTLAIAGLPNASPGQHFNEGQLEVRVTLIRNAYKMAKKLLRDVAASPG